MDTALALSELIGPSCFGILASYLEKGKIKSYPLHLLVPFIRHVEDVLLFQRFFKENGAWEKLQHRWPEFLKQLDIEKSPVIAHEFYQQENIPMPAPSLALQHFLEIRERHDVARACSVLQKILSCELDFPHATQSDILKCFFYTRDPIMQQVVDEVADMCTQPGAAGDPDQRDFFLTLYRTRYNVPSAGESLLIGSTLPLMAHRPIANRLEALFETHKQNPSIMQVLLDFCLLYLRNAPAAAYQPLLTLLPHG